MSIHIADGRDFTASDARKQDAEGNQKMVLNPTYPQEAPCRLGFIADIVGTSADMHFTSLKPVDPYLP